MANRRKKRPSRSLELGLPISIGPSQVNPKAEFVVTVENNTKDQDKTHSQLVKELTEVRQRIAELEAIEIEHEQAKDKLEHCNTQLTKALVRAGELRDGETEGHAERVAKMAVSLARAMEVGEEELGHIRSGALLHDIGKIGIPDSILFKAGFLTDQEWKIMRRHPVYAYELLSPITYLEPAVDIPYCHHERWDGTGYPRGLKGHEIPLAARIFSVVDVWDALGANRPYSDAWPPENIVDYIRESARTHFDPSVVEAFLELLSQ
ncbi:HD domain-containing protein [Acidobacteria bacterium AH-259-O06]|nr:HD domain-containing protein [Acidobacteria bacterium AH-259-O06]